MKGGVLITGASFDYKILSVLSHTEWKYGLQIQKALKGKYGKEFSLGKIYTTLDRLENEGLVEKKFGDEDSDWLRRPRRYARLTNDGVRCRYEIEQRSGDRLVGREQKA